MKITIAGSLGNIGKSLAEKLVSGGHELTVITSSADKGPAIAALGARAATGSVNDAEFLTTALRGADAVFAMTPPNLGGSAVLLNTVNAGKAFAKAIEESGVKRVVMLSSVGADQKEGTGPIVGLHRIEEIYGSLKNSALTILRAGYFYTNFYNDIPLIKGMGIIGGNYPGETAIPLVHPADIATAAAEELVAQKDGTTVRYVVSDVRSGQEIAAVLGSAIAKPDLPWVEFSDEQSLEGMKQAGLPEEIAALYTEMGQGIRKGLLQSDFEAQGANVTGRTTLDDFAKEFASSF
ncbi:NAD(P)H-binding protein [Pedobacter sp. AW31-3R]|uniref:NAD(P)H-binding protein n=1 Tax=Pedobacter sp. AW31-3R TaxID=3445781 RepID=UPI003FA155EE